MDLANLTTNESVLVPVEVLVYEAIAITVLVAVGFISNDETKVLEVKVKAV